MATLRPTIAPQHQWTERAYGFMKRPLNEGDEGYWKQIEACIDVHSDMEFSHSICPDCAKRLYPQWIARIKKDGFELPRNIQIEYHNTTK